MATPVHPRVHTRGERSQVRVIVYAPSVSRSSWVEAELAHEPVLVQIGHSVGQVVSALIEDPPPRPQLLIADFDDLEPGELMHLHVLREQGWFGRIIALGSVPTSLRSSLSIDHVLRPPFVRDALREVIAAAQYVTSTIKLPVL